MDDRAEALEYLGSRLDWVFSPDEADDLVEIIMPLYREGFTATRTARPAQPPAPMPSATGAGS